MRFCDPIEVEPLRNFKFIIDLGNLEYWSVGVPAEGLIS
ncbi:hypothetical protein D1AOALGA4SA_6336 [Olavius algarvensis Delta 1 endosymbiont]|nr:hypothetical protein D1AOALGA4SA_6336 [Olavius algarvensis Delta 1 endosymbiont]